MLNRFLQQHLMKQKKYVESIEKTPGAKVIMQASSSDKFMHIYNIDISNVYDLELQLISTKYVIRNKLKDSLDDFKKLVIFS